MERIRPARALGPLHRLAAVKKTLRPITLESWRLRLRPPVPADAPAITAFVSDPRVATMTALIPHPYPEGGAAWWIGQAQEAWRAGEIASFMICRRGSEELIGAISLALGTAGEVEIGYWIGVPHWGRGYATEALQRLLRYAFDELGLERVDTYHFSHNPASGRVMQKAGLRFRGVVPLGCSRGAERYDQVRYGIAAEDWRDWRKPQSVA